LQTERCERCERCGLSNYEIRARFRLFKQAAAICFSPKSLRFAEKKARAPFRFFFIEKSALVKWMAISRILFADAARSFERASNRRDDHLSRATFFQSGAPAPKQAAGATITRERRAKKIRAAGQAARFLPVLPCTTWGFSCPVDCSAGGGLLLRRFTRSKRLFNKS